MFKKAMSHNKHDLNTCMIKQFKTILLFNQLIDGLKSRDIAWETPVLSLVFKWPLIDTDIIYNKIKFACVCVCLFLFFTFYNP